MHIIYKHCKYNIIVPTKKGSGGPRWTSRQMLFSSLMRISIWRIYESMTNGINVVKQTKRGGFYSWKSEGLFRLIWQFCWMISCKNCCYRTQCLNKKMSGTGSDNTLKKMVQKTAGFFENKGSACLLRLLLTWMILLSSCCFTMPKVKQQHDIHLWHRVGSYMMFLILIKAQPSITWYNGYIYVAGHFDP